MKNYIALLAGLVVASSAGAQTISGVPYSITAGGTYVLSGNLTTSATGAITVNASSVEIDCHGFTITATDNTPQIVATNTNGLLIHNCKLANGGGVSISEGAGARIKANTFTGPASVSFVNDNFGIVGADFATPLVSDGNSFTGGGGVNGSHSDSMAIVGNLFSVGNAVSIQAAITLGTVNLPSIEYNTIDGGYVFGSPRTCSGVGTYCGADDGMFLTDINNATVAYNYVANTWDGCYETAGLTANSLFSYNSCDHALFAGYGSWHHTSMWNTRWFNNSASNTQFLFAISRSEGEGLRGCGSGWPGGIVSGAAGFTCPESTIWLQGNTFFANTFLSPAQPTKFYAGVLQLGGTSNPPASSYTIGGSGSGCVAGNPSGSSPFNCTNSIGGNNFNALIYQPVTKPASGFTQTSIDLCGPPYAGDPATYGFAGTCWK